MVGVVVLILLLTPTMRRKQMYVAKLVPVDGARTFFAVGRLFAGSISPGQAVHVMPPE